MCELFILKGGAGGDAEENEDDGTDVSAGKYGTYGMIQSTEEAPLKSRQFVHVRDLRNDKADQCVWLRGRLHTSRAKGKILHHLSH